MINNNPLRQFFRRPAVYVRLPSAGKYYAPGVVEMTESGELPVFPMTAIDDITLRTPDGLFNGTAVTEIIKSCVPNIKDPWAINNIDLDAILIAIRSASGDANLEIESTCTACGEESKYGVDLMAILTELKSANYDQELKISDLTIKFRPLNYKEMNKAAMGQFEAQKAFASLDAIQDENQRNEVAKQALQKITDLTMELLAYAIEFVEVPGTKVDNKEFIYDFLRNCDKNIYTEIRDFLGNLRQATEIKPLKIKCVNCSHEYDQPFTLNTSDFFA